MDMINSCIDTSHHLVFRMNIYRIPKKGIYDIYIYLTLEVGPHRSYLIYYIRLVSWFWQRYSLTSVF